MIAGEQINITKLMRRRLKRRLMLMRAGAAVFFVLSCIIAVRHFPGREHDRHLVLLKIHGTIASDVSLQTRALAKAQADPLVAGLILDVDSPGGAVAGGEALHDAVARFEAAKPVVVTMGGTAASAGYMISVPARRIFASRSTLTGSIGVMLQSPDISGLLGKLGISVDLLVSGPLKAQPSLVQSLSPAGREMLQGIVTDLYDQFITMVSDGRHMPIEAVRKLADGRPYTGAQALKLGLIDQIGDSDDARKWLLKAGSLPEQTRVEEIGGVVRPIGLVPRIIYFLTGNNSQGSVLSFLPQAISAVDGTVSIWEP